MCVHKINAAHGACAYSLTRASMFLCQKTINEDTGTKMINYFEVIRSLGKGVSILLACARKHTRRKTRTPVRRKFALAVKQPLSLHIMPMLSDYSVHSRT